ncbi:hypothetical protein ACU19_04865 [Actinobaculum suis]|nr:hypothetical protein ACU19_04865 [Actinobaculum suis]
MTRLLSACRVPGCPTPARGGLCKAHKAEYERSRPSSTARGYDATHKRLRAQWARQVEAGGVCCARCGGPITPGTPWDLGHTDDRRGYRGPEHSRCNRATMGRERPTGFSNQ